MEGLTDKLNEKLNTLPELPGIYKMLDSRGNIIYIGKSKCLKKRVKSYFTATPAWEKVKRMVGFIRDIEIIVTDTHLEARLLECELIKEVKPAFNAQMKQDKGYVYLKLEEYNIHNPLAVIQERSGQAYGPFRSRFKLGELIASLKNIYPIQKSGNGYLFEYHLMPVTMDKKAYEENQETLTRLLTDADEIQEFINALEAKMKEAAADFRFEAASRFRDLMSGMIMLESGINRYQDLITKNFLINIPIPGGNKLFFVSRGYIQLKKYFSKITAQETAAFIEKGLHLRSDGLSERDEKEAIDFRDILFSEILSLPEDMVRVLE
jgi:excinuclease ABC subunit C